MLKFSEPFLMSFSAVTLTMSVGGSILTSFPAFFHSLVD